MIDKLRKELTAVWNEKDPISIKIEYTGQKSYTIESMTLEYQDSEGKKNWIEYPVKSDACTTIVTQIVFLPHISGKRIVDGKLKIGFTDPSNQKLIGDVQIKNGG